MFGTMILVSTIVFISATGRETSAIPLGLYCAILIGGHVTGAHYNPAVTLAVVIGRKHFDKLDLAILFYMVPQFIGGFLGFLIPKFFVDYFIVEDYGIPLLPYLNSDGDYANFNALLVEIWATFIFTLVWLCVTNPDTYHTDIGAINGACVVIGLWVGINIASKVSGAALNPAVGLSLNVCSKVFYSNSETLGKVWIYLVGPWVGSILSGAFYAFFHHLQCGATTNP